MLFCVVRTSEVMADHGENTKKSKKKEKSGSENLKSKHSQSAWSWSSIRRSLLVSVGTSSLGKGAIINNLPYETQNLIRSLVSSYFPSFFAFSF